MYIRILNYYSLDYRNFSNQTGEVLKLIRNNIMEKITVFFISTLSK